MAYLRKINGRYYAYFTDRNRKPKEKSISLGTGLKSAAVLKFNELQRRWADPSDPFNPWNPAGASQRDSATFLEAKAQFLESRRHLRPHSVRTYDDVLRWLGERLPPNLMLRDLSSDQLKRFVHDSSISRASQRKRFTHVRAFLRWCVKAGLLESSPLVAVEQPKEQRRLPEFLTAKQLERLLAAIDADYQMKQAERQAYGRQILWLKDVIVLAVSTGMRQAELLNLRWQHVDFDSNLIVLRNTESFTTKSGHERTIPIVRPAREVLERLHASGTGDGYVLKGQGGGRLNGNHVSRRFKHYVRLAKLPENIRFHSLRHTCASWLVQKGFSLEITGAILGHSDTRVTKQYAHLAPDVLTKAMQQTFDRL